jgi:hypothetical protein
MLQDGRRAVDIADVLGMSRAWVTSAEKRVRGDGG